mgnify:CR=1 FL=1|jgi:hypothetical protein
MTSTGSTWNPNNISVSTQNQNQSINNINVSTKNLGNSPGTGSQANKSTKGFSTSNGLLSNPNISGTQ